MRGDEDYWNTHAQFCQLLLEVAIDITERKRAEEEREIEASVLVR